MLRKIKDKKKTKTKLNPLPPSSTADSMNENSTKINAIFSLIKPLHRRHNTTMESQSPLISTIVTLYTLIFLYFPTFAASPLIISTSLLLLSLLRLGAAQRISLQQTQKKHEKPKPHSVVDLNSDPDPLQLHDEPDPRPFYGDCFVEWNVRAPLEVIYEAYEGEEEEEYTEDKRDEELRVMERYASLSMYYPETDTDTDSSSDAGNWDSPENVYFRWDDDEDRDELIEIELDCKRNTEVEEENLIEIDLTPPNFPVR